MTNREFFNAVIAGNVTEAEVEFAKAALAKIDEKNEKRKGTLNKNQKANEGLKETIIGLFAENEVLTAKTVGEALEVSTQKASALLRQLAQAGVIVGAKAKASAPIEFRLAGNENAEVEEG